MAGGGCRGAQPVINGSVMSEKPREAEDDVGKQFPIVKNKVVLELIDIRGLRVGNLPPGSLRRCFRGFNAYSRGVEL